jgi:glycosyltransferase involved in cell wall biosynthesis
MHASTKGGPRVSIVIATYNRAALLPATIESILKQRFQDFELIVVDDGSADDTRGALAPYESRIRYVYQENRGPSAARNFGVRHAKAPWIAILDSDDLCAPSHLEALYGHVAARPDCAMVFANGAYVSGLEHNRETIIPAPKSRQLEARGVRLIDIFEKSIVRLQAALISKSAYEAVGGHDESLRICMDLDLAFRMFMSFPVAYLDEVVFFYRKHEGNIGRNEELRLAENICVIEKLLRDFSDARTVLGPKKVAQRLAYRYYRLAKGRWKRDRKKDARAALQAAIRLCPGNFKYRLYQMEWALALRS